MKSPKPAGIHNPFEELSDLLKKRSIRLEAVAPAAPAPRPKPPIPSLSEEEAFFRAVSDVRRIDWNRYAGCAPAPRIGVPETDAEDAALNDLKRLVDCGAGFKVSSTPEYMEGVSPHAPPGIARRLHRGDFAVQGHIDLHGFTASEARLVFDAFIERSISLAHRTVLVVHGRGLSSPAEPVLKSKVLGWLSCGRWRKWVIAFTSARMCDGGAGASYVLLRQRPLARRLRKGHFRGGGAQRPAR